MRRIILFALFFGLFAFSMSILIKERFRKHHPHHSDGLIYKLAEEVRELKHNQALSRQWMENLSYSHEQILSTQEGLGSVRDELIHELSKVKKITYKTQEALENVYGHLNKQQDSIKSLSKSYEKNKGHNSDSREGYHYGILDLNNAQKELANNLETFKGALQVFEARFSNDNKKINEELKNIKTFISQSSATKNEVRQVEQSNQNAQRVLLNELNNHKDLVNQAIQSAFRQGDNVRDVSGAQIMLKKVDEELNNVRSFILQTFVTKDELEHVQHSNQNFERVIVDELNIQKSLIKQISQNSLKQGTDIRDTGRTLTSFKEYVLDAIQQLAQKDIANEKRYGKVGSVKRDPNAMDKQDNEVKQLTTELKNFKEYTLEALQELRSFNNKNSKRINHIKKVESEVPTSEVISQEVQKFFDNFADGKLLEKILGGANFSSTELQTLIKIVKMLAEGDVTGAFNVVNELSGGNLMRKVMQAKDEVMKDLKPYMKYAKLLKKYVVGDHDEDEYVVVEQQAGKNKRRQRNDQIGLGDILNWLN